MQKHYFNKILPGNRTTLRVLTRAIIRGGALVATDMDQWVFVENEMTRVPRNDGTTYDLTLLKKNPSLKTAVCNDHERAEFPDLTDFRDPVFLPFDVVGRLPAFLPYCSQDYTSRVSLTGVHLNLHEGVIIGTDGHGLREDQINKTGTGRKDGYIISQRAAIFIKAMKREILLSAEVDDRYVKLVYAGKAGDIITYYDRLIEGPFPNYRHIIPNETDGTLVDTLREQRARILDGIRRLQMFGSASKRADPIIFDDDSLTWKSAHGYKTLRGLPKIFEKTPRALSVTYLKRVFSDISTTTATVQSFADRGRIVCFRSLGSLFVIMPIKPAKKQEWPPVGEVIS